MSDDEADPELLALLAASLGLNAPAGPPQIRVLKDAEYIYDHSIDVALDASNTIKAAEKIWQSMQEKQYSFKSWTAHELHPKAKDESTVDFIFTMDLLNFCFWVPGEDGEVFTVEYRDKKWTGYWALIACLQRALEEDIPITTPTFWADKEKCSDAVLQNVFRSATSASIPLLDKRIAMMKHAGEILVEQYEGSFVTLVEDAKTSAARLVNFVVEDFPMFCDESKFDGKTVRLYKRAQILVADLWAAFEGQGYGQFDDIDSVTMFADYRIPQMLQRLGCLSYSPKLEHCIKTKQEIEHGHTWEVQIRGCTIWCVELIRREIQRKHKDAKVNAILIDFLLYDTVKDQGDDAPGLLPHHRTRSIWY